MLDLDIPCFRGGSGPTTGQGFRTCSIAVVGGGSVGDRDMGDGLYPRGVHWC